MYNDRISVDFADESCNEMFISYFLCISGAFSCMSLAKVVIEFNNMDNQNHVLFVWSLK